MKALSFRRNCWGHAVIGISAGVGQVFLTKLECPPGGAEEIIPPVIDQQCSVCFPFWDALMFILSRVIGGMLWFFERVLRSDCATGSCEDGFDGWEWSDGDGDLWVLLGLYNVVLNRVMEVCGQWMASCFEIQQLTIYQFGKRQTHNFN